MLLQSVTRLDVSLLNTNVPVVLWARLYAPMAQGASQGKSMRSGTVLFCAGHTAMHPEQGWAAQSTQGGGGTPSSCEPVSISTSTGCPARDTKANDWATRNPEKAAPFRKSGILNGEGAVSPASLVATPNTKSTSSTRHSITAGSFFSFVFRKMEAEGEEGQLYKVLVIGDYGVGKTSIIRRYTEGYYSPNYKLTIGVDFSLKTLEHEGKSIKLQLWDIAGHERFGHMTHVYYKYAIAAVIVFDLGRPATFESVVKWHRDLNSKVELPSGGPVPCILLANKCDLYPGDIDTQRLDQFCKEKNIQAWFPTSAKNDQNIGEAVKFLVKCIVDVGEENLKPQVQPDAFVRLEEKEEARPAEKKCCD
eukprot:m.200654 g.200654  ORF g.200654 m.200654 type:complete len:363 (-) comp21920_c1_seq1:36-1124(-)